MLKTVFPLGRLVDTRERCDVDALSLDSVRRQEVDSEQL